MNYFELINQCLIELNYKQVTAFENLVKVDHKKLMSIINRVNNEVCSSADWWFKERKTGIVIPDNEIEVDNTISGKINAIVIDGVKYCYFPDYEKFYTQGGISGHFSLFNDKLLLPKFADTKSATVFYSTNDFAVDVNGTAKDEFELETDQSILPEPYALPVVVYGTCMKFKALPSHQRFKFWNAEYIKAIRNMKSSCLRAGAEEPRLVIG